MKKLSRPFQSLIHARRTYRELRLLKHLKHENVSRDPARGAWAGLSWTAVLTPLLARSSGCWTSSPPPPPLRTSAKCKRRPSAAREGAAGLGPDAARPASALRYLVTTLMGADLNNIVKCQALTDEHVQFLVYQLLRGLKVGAARGRGWMRRREPDAPLPPQPPQYIHSAGIIHRVGAQAGLGAGAVRVGLAGRCAPLLTPLRPAGPEAQQRGGKRGLRAQGEPRGQGRALGRGSGLALKPRALLQILDFGLARQADEEMTGYVATRWYRAPEIMLNWMHYNQTGDGCDATWGGPWRKNRAGGQSCASAWGEDLGLKPGTWAVL